MPIDQQDACCIIELCCGGDHSQQVGTLAKWLIKEAGLSPREASRAAVALAENFDFAPKDTLSLLKHAIAEMVRAHYPYNPRP